jgi:hypothetical protein
MKPVRHSWPHASLLRAAGLPRHQIAAVLRRLEERPAAPESHAELWRSFGDLPWQAVDALRFASNLDALVDCHEPLARLLRRMRAQGAIERCADLIGLDWERLIVQRQGRRAVGTPRALAGGNAAERARRYAAQVRDRVAALFPAETLADMLGREGDATDAAAARFVRDNPALDLAGVGIDAYLGTHSQALAGVPEADQAGLVERLRRWRRLLQLTDGMPGQVALARRLLALGLDSAQAIASIGAAALHEALGSAAAQAQTAQALHARASRCATTALALLASFSPRFDPVGVAAIHGTGKLAATGNAAAPTAGGGGAAGAALFVPGGGGPAGGGGPGAGGPRLPDWYDLFGSLDHLRGPQSALSPSAYLADLLHLLGKLTLGPRSVGRRARTALDLLLERRPDIARLEHTAANADTPMPYVDLVNEVLEAAVHAQPFDLGLDIEPLLDEHGAPSAVLRQAFAGRGHVLSAQAVIRVVDEALEWEVLDRGWTYRIEDWTDDRTGSRYRHVTVTAPPLQTTGQADDLRAIPEHTRDELYELLRNQRHPWVLPFDLWAEEARIGLKALGLERHALIDLFGATPGREALAASDFFGLTSTETTLLAGAPGQLATPPSWGFAEDDREWLRTLARLPVFLRRSGLDLTQAKALLATRYVNASGGVGLRFQAPSTAQERITVSPCDPERATVAGLDDPKDPQVLDRIQRFLRLQRKTPWTIPEFDRVLAALGCTPQRAEGFDGAVLARARRVAQWQQRFGLPLDELLAWVAGIDHRPAADGGASPYERLFHDRSLQASASAAFELDATGAALRKPVRLDRAADRGVICAALRIDARELSRWAAGLWGTKDGAGAPEVDLAGLSALYRWTSLARATKLSVDDALALRGLAGAGGAAAADPFAQIEHFLAAWELARDGGLGVDAIVAVLGGGGRSAAGSAAGPAEPSPGERLLDELRDTLGKGRAERAASGAAKATTPREVEQAPVVRGFALLLSLAPATVQQLLFSLPPGRGTVLLDPAFVAGTPQADADAARLVRGMQRAALAIAGWGLDDGFEALCAALATAGFTALDAVLRACLAGDPAAYEDFAAAAAMAGARRRLGAAAFNDLLALVPTDPPQPAGGDRNAALDRLAAALDLGIEDIERLAKALARPCSADGLQRFASAAAALKTLGVHAQTAIDWAQPEVSPEVAAAIRRTLKSRHDQARWLEVAAPLREGLRERQRATLVACLLARLDLADSYALYQHYLIDVEMGPRTLTSRTRLAISSVQLFVQRLLMNLERERVPGDERARECLAQWASLKNYRVWEAGRKIFLYPENWIEPELRKDKTALFRALESELAQQELSAEAADQALRRYLERLDELARLQICALAFDPRRDTQVLHLFGRTRSVPAAYHHRRREDGVWTSWDRLDVGLDGQHLIPVVFEGRLYLFWPEFSGRTAAEIRAGDKRLETERNLSQSWDFWELRLAFSQWRNGAWTAKRLLDGTLAVDLPPGASVSGHGIRLVPGAAVPSELAESGQPPARPPRRARCDTAAFTFQVQVDDGSLRIQCLKQRAAGGRDETVDEGSLRFSADECVRVIAGSREPTPSAAAAAFKGSFRHDAMALVPADTETRLLLADGSPLLNLLPRRLTGHGASATTTSRGVRLVVGVPGAGRAPAPAGAGVAAQPFVYQDEDRCYLVTPALGGAPTRFENLYHPVATDFLKQLARHGLDSLLQRQQQLRRSETTLFRLAGTKELEPLELEKNLKLLGERGVLADRGLAGLRAAGRTDDASARPSLISLAVGDPASRTLRCTAQVEGGELSVWQDAAQLYDTPGLPPGEVDFSLQGAYSAYNWEIFFHLPLLLADRFSKDQRFEQAQRWFHHVFDPTDLSAEEAPQRYWKFKVFFDEAALPRVVQLRELAAYDGDDALWTRRRDDLAAQIGHWRRSPFDPHVIAMLRTSAYQKSVVMKYIDNLIAWGDQLFRQDTIESINEATQHYLLAAEILGRRPLVLDEPIAAAGAAAPAAAAGTGAADPAAGAAATPAAAGAPLPSPRRFRDAFAELEDRLLAMPDDAGHDDPALRAQALRLPLFSVPGNDKLLGYWDLVEDRLFKIRHSQTIEGAERQLALYEPPIEPGLLVRAAAAGADIAAVMREQEAPLPPYRFPVMLHTALQCCDDVRALGADFLAALERKDAEGLEQLRARQVAFSLQRQILDKSADELTERVDELELVRGRLQKRIAGYEDRIAELENKGKQALAALGGMAKPLAGAVKSGVGLYKTVKEDRKWRGARDEVRYSPPIEPSEGEGEIRQALFLAHSMYAAGAATSTFPTLITGAAGVASPVALTMTGGGQMKDHWDCVGKGFELLGQMAEAAFDAVKAVQERKDKAARLEDDKAQAGSDLECTERQLAAVRIRREIVDLERRKVDQAAADAAQVEGWLKSRFTSLELYQWRVAQLSTLHFQSYRMAYDLAKRAEAAFAAELGQPRPGIVRFGQWDSLKKGLLAAEQLRLDLRRLHKAYLEQNRRGYEITKPVSLRRLLGADAWGDLVGGHPVKVHLQEDLFDDDYPGHYLRRLKAVSVTMDLAAGDDVQPVSCRLALEASRVRVDRARSADKLREDPPGAQAIVTSGGRDDSGLFRLDLDDERFLPFEGAGAISDWTIELRGAASDTLKDLTLTLRYTAREGGEPLVPADLRGAHARRADPRNPPMPRSNP